MAEVMIPAPVDAAERRVLIGTNRGGTNGWTGYDRVFGIAFSVAGVDRPGVKPKLTIAP